MMFPKKKRFRSKASLVSYRLGKDCCEWCHVYTGEAGEVHHIKKRSQMGGDEHENLIFLCGDCHRFAHGVDSREYEQKFKGLKNGI